MRIPESYFGQDVQLNPLPAVRQDTRPQPNALVELGNAAQVISAENAKHAATQDAFEKAEGSRIAAVTTEQSKALIERNAREIVDPDEFETKTTEALRELHSTVTKDRMGPARYAAQALEAPRIAYLSKIGELKFAKQKDQAVRSVEDTLQTYARMAIQSDDENERSGVGQAFGDMIGHLENRGLLSANLGGDYIRKFSETITKGRTARFETAIAQDLDGMVNAATTGQMPPGELYQQGVARIDKFQDIPVEKRDRLKSAFKDSLWTGAIEGRIERDPFKADEELKAGLYNTVIDPQSLRFLKNKAEAEIAAISRQAEAMRKENEKQIGKQVKDFSAAVMNGFTWNGNMANLAGAVKGTEHEQEFLDTVRDAQTLFAFNLKTPVQQEQYLRDQAQQPMDGGRAKLMGKLATAHQQLKQGLKDDALSYAIKTRAIPSLMPFDLNNPNSLKERSIAAGMVEQRYGTAVSPLSDDEAQAVINAFEKGTADARFGMLQKLTAGFEPRQARALAGALAKKDQGLMAHAMELTITDPEVSHRILKGQDILKQNREALPSNMGEARRSVAVIIGDAYRLSPAQYEAVVDSTMAVYALRSWNTGDLTGKLEGERLRLSVEEAGGGIVGFNGRRTVPPSRGFTEAQMKTLVSEADYKDLGTGFTKQDILEHGKLEMIRRGEYLVRIGSGYAESRNGKAFVLDLNPGAGKFKVKDGYLRR